MAGQKARCPGCNHLLTVPRQKSKAVRRTPTATPESRDPVEDLLSRIARSTADAARDVRQVRNLIALVMVMGLLLFLAELALSIYLQ